MNQLLQFRMMAVRKTYPKKAYFPLISGRRGYICIYYKTVFARLLTLYNMPKPVSSPWQFISKTWASLIKQIKCIRNIENRGAWVTQSVGSLPCSQVMISVSWDWDPCWVPCLVGSVLLSFSPSALPPCSFSLPLNLSLK